MSGLPASGKSTIGRELAKTFDLQFLDKDLILEHLFETEGVGDSAWRSKLSRIADEEFQRLAANSNGAVLASWWCHPKSEAKSGTSVNWLSGLSGELVEVHCMCNLVTTTQRFLTRKRHLGHNDHRFSAKDLVEEFSRQVAFGPLEIGRLVRVATDSSVDYAELLSAIAWNSIVSSGRESPEV